MGGYALYVWGSVGVSFALLGLESWWAWRERVRTLAWLRAEQGKKIGRASCRERVCLYV